MKFFFSKFFQHTHKTLFNSDSWQLQGIFLRNEQHPYSWSVKLTFDKIQVVTDLGCSYSNENYY